MSLSFNLIVQQNQVAPSHTLSTHIHQSEVLNISTTLGKVCAISIVVKRSTYPYLYPTEDTEVCQLIFPV